MLDSTRRILAAVAGVEKTAGWQGRGKAFVDLASRHKKGIGAGGALAALGTMYFRPETLTNLYTNIRRYNRISDKIEEAIPEDDPGLKDI